MTRTCRFFLALVTLVTVAGCSVKPKPPAIEPPAAGQPPPLVQVKTPDKPGLAFRLSEGKTEAGPYKRPPLAAATRLGAAAVRKILHRLPPLPASPADQKAFAFRGRSLPPPRTGRTIHQSFPAATNPNAVQAPASGPLRVVRYAPKGPVPIAPHLSVTFSQPMVAVTGARDLAAQSVPVKITPAAPGKWRWLGTRTLLFQPATRFPMATAYHVEIPAGTRSATGGHLAKAVSFAFTTPAPRVKTAWPTGGPTVRDPVFFLGFDQRVDPAKVLATVKVTAGDAHPSLRLATETEIQGDDTVSRLLKKAEPGRTVAFVATARLPGNTTVNVKVGPGTPSLEGPRTTEKPRRFSFRTYGPMKVVDHRCGYQGRCPPGTPFMIRFSNPIDGEQFQQAMVTADPAIPGMKVSAYGPWMYVYGRMKARTRYHVTLAASIPDRFDQTLGKNHTVTFHTTDAEPRISAAKNGLVVLDPSADRQFSVFSIGNKALRVQAYRVTPADWNAYARYMRRGAYRNDPRAKIPGKRVLSTRIKVQGDPNELSETRIDLSPVLKGRYGNAIVVVRPAVQPKQRWRRQVLVNWVEATDIGLDAFADGSQLLAWATNLRDGKPLSGVKLSLEPGGAQAVTGQAGVARIPLTTAPGRVLLARSGSDVAILPEYLSWWVRKGNWKKQDLKDGLVWYVIDDRHIYKPKETVHVKGWVRRVEHGANSDLVAMNGLASHVTYKVVDSRGNDVRKGDAALDAMGGFDLSFSLPDQMNLGTATLVLTSDAGKTVPGRITRHAFQVQEFRRPEYEVKTTPSPGPYLLGTHTNVTLSASYYAGGALPGADVTWRATARPGSFIPPGRADYVFGRSVPWWGYFNRRGQQASRPVIKTLTGKTDATGKNIVRIDFDGARPAQAMNVTVQGTVRDVNRQAWTSTAELLVHPAKLYVGLKAKRPFVRRTEPIQIDAIVTDLDGKAVAGRPIAMKAERLEWKLDGEKFTEKVVSTEKCKTRSTTKNAHCSFKTPEGGVYRITADITDLQGRRNDTQLTVWVTGGKTPPQRGVRQQRVTLIPDKKEYKVGDTAEVAVLAPFAPAEGLLTLRREGIVETRRFTMKAGSTTLKVPIRAAYLPNVHVHVDLVGQAARTGDNGVADPTLPRRPAFATGTVNLSVPPRQRTLHVTVTPQARKLAPGGTTWVDVGVKDSDGRPVAGGQVAVVVVDEAVLSLTHYKLPDPLDAFYFQRGPGVQEDRLRAALVLANPLDVQTRATGNTHILGGFGVGRGGGAAAGEGDSTIELDGLAANNDKGVALPAASAAAEPEGHASLKRSEAFAEQARGPGAGHQAPTPIQLRKTFNALAVFAPRLPTDASGHARVKVKLPDSLTRYRVMVVAVSGNRYFGKGESTITARLPLMVRPSPPRFLNFGDRFELPVVVHNQTDHPMKVKVAVRARNASFPDGQGRAVTVPANDRVEVRIPTAAGMPGTARFQVGAVAGRFADANQFKLPVWTPATTEAFATYGTVAGKRGSRVVIQPVSAPKSAVTQFGGLEVTTSSTQLQALTDAVIYLVNYPYECAEQISSRVLAIAALRDVLSAFKAEGLPKPAVLIKAVGRDIDTLKILQEPDGGFAFWRRGDPSWPWVSIHAAHALIMAKQKGFAVPAEMLERSARYLKSIESHIPSWYPARVRWTIIAYALDVRRKMGDNDPARARRLIAEAGLRKLSLEAVGFLLPVLSGNPASHADVVRIRRLLANRAEEQAGTAHFVTSYSDGANLLLHSSRRADGILLEALLDDSPKSSLVPKLVAGLLAHRTRGHWENTQENAFILLALDRYFHVYEKTTPDFVARAWLGDQYAGGHTFKGRQTDRYDIDVPMALVARAGKTHLILQRKGKGRLYYRIGMRYAPKNLVLKPADYGFTVARVYEPVDDPKDVTREKDGTWIIKAGARVRVRVTMVAPSRRYHVALVDELPAGLEPMNPSLAVTGSVPPDPKSPRARRGFWWWLGPWYEHQNMRDERVEAFASLVWEGVHEYSYVARATTPGTFVAPPAKAEEMYHPEVFGRSGTDKVIVK